jgi:hypothetical protein
LEIAFRLSTAMDGGWKLLNLGHIGGSGMKTSKSASL